MDSHRSEKQYANRPVEGSVPPKPCACLLLVEEFSRASRQCLPSFTTTWGNFRRKDAKWASKFLMNKRKQNRILEEHALQEKITSLILSTTTSANVPNYNKTATPLTCGLDCLVVPCVTALTELCSSERAIRSSSNTSSPKMSEEVAATVALCTRADL